MKRVLKILLGILCLATPTAARANDFGNLAMAAIFGYGGFGWNNQPMVVNNFTPPYFSMHPPVYYGDRYYRPYGDSPYASWPQLQPNPAYSVKLHAAHAQPAPLTVANPYCPPVAMAPTPAPVPARITEPSYTVPAGPSNDGAVEPTAPSIQSDKPAEPAQPENKVPDVVKRATGPLTIENPYFQHRFIKKPFH